MDKTTVQDAITQLTALGFEYGDEVKLGLYAKPDKKLSPRKAKGTMPLLPLDAITKAEEEGRSIYFCVNRDYKNEDIKECRVLFYEHDDIPKDQSLVSWQTIGLPTPTLQVDTGGKSIHTYYLLDEPIAPELWRTLQQGFIYHLKSDPSLHNPGRVMRLAGSVHPDTGEVAKVCKQGEIGMSYPVETFIDILAIPTAQTLHNPKDDVSAAINYLNHMGASVAEDYHSWMKVGMALKAVSSSLKDEWVRWSSQSTKAINTNFDEKWDSFKGSGVGIGTLWYYAYNFGSWKGSKPRPDLILHEGNEHQTRNNAFKECVDKAAAFLNGSLRYNTLDNTYIFRGEPKSIDDIVGDVEYDHAVLYRHKERAVINKIAKQNEFNPIVDYIKSCEFKPNVSHENVASKYWGGTSQEDEYVSLFLRAAVLRQLPQVTPIVFPFVLVLIGKSATFETFFKGWKHDMADFKDPHQGIGLSKNWLCLWDEMLPVLETKNRDIINRFVTNNYQTQNIMYGEKHKQSPRTFVIGGTTTDYQFLSDTYSQRRWMVCKIPRGTRVNIPQLAHDADAIWASAYKAVCINKSLGSFDELIKVTTQENRQYVNESDYQYVVTKAVDQYLKQTEQDFIYVPALLSFMWDGKVIPKDMGREVCAILKNNGYHSKRCTKGVYRDKSIWVKD
jgi:hypothetical protein